MPDTRPFIFPSSVGLCEGSTGPQVEILQAFLHRFGYLHIDSMSTPFAAAREAANPPHGTLKSFDAATTTAMQNFQRFNGLPTTGVLDKATIAHMGQPRCGFPDIPSDPGISNFVAQGNKWNKTDLTYGFQEFTPDLTPQQIRDAMTAALNLWSQVTPLKFKEVPLASKPDFVIRFVVGDHGDGSPFDGIGRTLAHAFYPPPNGGERSGDAHFDEAEPWSVTLPIPRGKFDLITVAAHEFGHSLGLAHSADSKALMFPTIRGAQRSLSKDDIDGIQSIYGSG